MECAKCGQPIQDGQSYVVVYPCPRTLDLLPGPRHVSCPKQSEIARRVRLGRPGWTLTPQETDRELIPLDQGLV